VDWWCQSNCQKCANLSVLHLQTEEPFFKFLKSIALKTVLLKLNSKWHQMKVSIACKVSDHQLHHECTGTS
jgi:hypothetical protein